MRLEEKTDTYPRLVMSMTFFFVMIIFHITVREFYPEPYISIITSFFAGIFGYATFVYLNDFLT